MLVPRRIPSRALLLSLLLCGLSSGLQAQTSAKGGNPSASQKKNPALLARQREVNNYQQFAAYWTTEAGWHTELQMRNNLSNKQLTVTPVLRASDGAELVLDAVTVASRDTASVDVNDALRAAPQFVGKYGSVVFRYSANVNGALYASVMIGMPGTPIMFHLDAALTPEKWARGSRDGIWWLNPASAADYLILTNTSDHKLQAQLFLYDAAGKESQQKISIDGRQTSRLSTRTLLQNAGLQGEYGAIKMDMGTGAGFLDSAHLVFDESNGYSALMKMFDHDPQATLSERAWGKTKRSNEWIIRAPMLALTNPDPVLAFPAETKLEPKILVHNSTGKAYSANLTLHWRSAAASGASVPVTIALKAHGTEMVDVAALQVRNLVPAEANWAFVEISAPVQPEELIAIASSSDKTGRYGAQTPFSDQLAYHWEGGKWQVDSTHNSLIAAGNGGEKPVKAKMTLFYNGGREKYEIEQTLAPDQQMWVDVGKLIRNQVPDANGKALPADLTSGSYQLLEGETNGIGNLFEGKLIVDKTYGHAAYGCMTCCAPRTGLMVFDPLGLGSGLTDNQGISGTDACTADPVDMTSWYTSWWTGNTSIATANMWAMTGQGPGSTTDSASGTFQWGTGEMRHVCRTTTDTRGGGVNVKPIISGPNTVWWFNGENPSGYATQITLTATGGNGVIWGVIAGGEKVTTSATGNQLVVRSSGTSFSQGVGDVQITAQINSETSDPFRITTRTPRLLVFRRVDHSCDSLFGYDDILHYDIQDQLFTNLPADVAYNEKWSTLPVDDSTTNWDSFGRPSEVGTVSFGADLNDFISGVGVNNSPTPNPFPVCSGNSTKVHHWGQDLRIGSTAIGNGKLVQTDNLTRFADHATHESVISPVP